MFKLFTLSTLLLISLSLQAKDLKKFTFEDAMKFKGISGVTLSDDGKWTAFISNPDRGDGEIHFIQTNDSSKQFKFERGALPIQFSKNSNYAVFSVIGKTLETLNAKTDKEKPQKALQYIDLTNGNSQIIENIASYTLSNDGNWLLYKKIADKTDSKDDKKKKQVGDNLFLLNLKSNSEILIQNNSEFVLDSACKYLFYSIADEKGKRDGLYFKSLTQDFAPEVKVEVAKDFAFSNLSWNANTEQLAYLTSKLDSNNKPLPSVLKLYKMNEKQSFTLFKDSALSGYYIPNKNKLEWNQNGTMLWFGMKTSSEKFDKNEDKPKFTKDNLYDTKEIAKETQLYLWHNSDEVIIPMQKKNWEKEKDKLYMNFIDFENKVSFYLPDTTSSILKNENTNFALLNDENKHLKEILYSGDYEDLYLLNLKNGKRTLLTENLQESASLSPNGKYSAYFVKGIWTIYNNVSAEKIVLNDITQTNFSEELNDVPEEASSNGIAGWLNNDSLVYLYDNYNIWEFDIANKRANQLTDSKSVVKYRIRKFPNQNFFNISDTLLITFQNKQSKESGILSYSLREKRVLNSETGKYFYRNILKAKNSDKIVFQKENFNEFPNLWVTKQNFEISNKLTDLHPELNDFIGANVKIINYVTPKGDSLQGYLLLPTNVKSEKLPVLIYFYERMSDGAYQFNMPAINHRPCYQIYLSEGYAMFFPDIKFYTGYPGKISEETLIAASKQIVAEGYADENKIALWGHSWSGYQGAYIATQTNYFKAIVAGAPVGNMTSAYSGIRLESGRARQFQYEKQQSRIGGNLVDSLDAFIRNSPIFFANNMNVPLLIMHGDVDDAVPFSQGVELHLAMKRFNKNSILLQYENEPHHPKKYANKLDYALRMKEFYDHYILNKPASSWLINGVKYKGDYNK